MEEAKKKKRRKRGDDGKGREKHILDREDSEQKVYTEVAMCVWRIDLGISVRTEAQRIFQIVRSSRKVIRIKEDKHMDQP